jgi:uncharacterized protein
MTIQGTRDKGQGTKDNPRSAAARAAVLLLVLFCPSPFSLVPCPLSLVPCPFSLVPSPLSLVAAQPPPPALTDPVNDFASIIDPQTEEELGRRIRALQQASGDVIVVATVPSMEPYSDINEFARRMFENGGRGIGQKGKDNGALIVLALKEKQVRVETGYDLEEFITDGFAGDTIRGVMRPAFQRGDFGQGLLAGATRLINRVAERRGVELQSVPRDRQPMAPPREFHVSWKVIVLVWILIMILSSRNRRRRRRRWGSGPWSGWNSGVGPFGGGGFGGFGGGFGGFGGGGGGGFGGFGGGRSGGGGASGSW